MIEVTNLSSVEKMLRCFTKLNSPPNPGLGFSVARALGSLTQVYSQLGRQLFLMKDVLGRHLVNGLMVG